MQPFTEEMKLLGKILKINQKIEGKSFDKYNYIRGIEKGISKILNRKEKNGFYPILSDSKFSLIEFILDADYRNSKIADYEHLIKKGVAQFNILQLITDSAHFGEMFKLIALDKRLLSAVSIKSRLTDHLVSKVEAKKSEKPQFVSVTREEYKRIENFANDVLIYNYFAQRENPLVLNISGKPITLNSI
ncbi:MAG: hypothetical protein J6V44_12365 [Methanobrevibacter sp.]|nr:hypothetical protein [Methanobrevibacter sp.]